MQKKILILHFNECIFGTFAPPAFKYEVIDAIIDKTLYYSLHWQSI